MPIVMIVDDDQNFLQVAAVYIQMLGYTPLSTSDPTQVFRILGQNSVDLILMDVYMPELDGIELLKQLRDHPEHGSVPVIMLTGDKNEKLLADCFELGAKDFISKPIRPVILKSRIKSALSTKNFISQLAGLNEKLEMKVNQRTEELQHRLKMERFIGSVSNNFIHLPVSGIGNEINLAMEKLGALLAVDRIHLYLFSGNGDKVDITHQWRRERTHPLPEGAKYRDMKNFPWFMERLNRFENINIPSVTGLPQGAEAEKQKLGSLGVRACIMVPLIFTERIIGFLELWPVGEEKKFSGQDIGIIRILGEIFVNALERKKSDIELRKSQDSLVRAQEIAHLGNWDWDIVSNKLTLSDEAYRIFGLKPREFELTYEFFLNSAHPDDRDFVKTFVDQALGQNKPYSFEYRIILPDGSARVVHQRGEVCFDKHNNPARMLGTVQDISELKQAEEALSRSEKRLQSILDNTTAVVYLKDTKGKYILINHRYEALFHIKKEKIIGKTDYDLFPREMADNFTANDQNVLVAKAPVEFEETVPQDDGIHTYISIKFPLFDSSGNTYGVCGISTDITGRKKMEKELAQAEKMASLGTLVAGVAHEINNPNNNIVLNIPAIKNIWGEAKPFIKSGMEAAGVTKLGNKPASESIVIFERLVSLIEKGADQIDKIVTDLKNYARVDNSGFENEVDLSEVINTSIKLTELHARDAFGHFSLQLEPLPLIKGNFQKLAQVFINLLINAFQALDSHGQAVELKARHDKAKDRVIIDIRDEGKGMDVETLKKVMEPFFTTKQNSGGTGLGVSISYGIIRDHGGRINYESRPGQGTVATIWLPVSSGTRF